MLERVANILKHDIMEIIGSPLVLELLCIYSELYLNGSQPGSCDKCIIKYWYELNFNGMELAVKNEEIKKRTLVPKWNGLYYVQKAARHFDSNQITDTEACKYLLDGQLRESDFNKLPEEWIEYKKNLEEEEKAKVKKETPIKEDVKEDNPVPKKSKAK